MRPRTTVVRAASVGSVPVVAPKKKARKLETCSGCGASVRSLVKHKSKCPGRYGDFVRNGGDKKIHEALGKTNGQRRSDAMEQALKPNRKRINSKRGGGIAPKR